MKSPLVQSAFHKAQQLAGLEFATEIQKHAESYQKMLDQLGAAVAAGHKKKCWKAQHLIFRSYSAKLVCLVRSLDQWPVLAPETIREMAASLNPYKDCGEKIIWWAEPKGLGNDWRPVCSFGPKRQATHSLIVDILMARFGIDEINYLAKGKGAERASDLIVHLVEQKEFSYFVLGDIKDFFRSVQHGSVIKALGLPIDVVKNNVFISSAAALTMVGGFPPDEETGAFNSGDAFALVPLDGAAQQGLPQGSRASAVIAALLLGPALREVASAERAVFYGDDFALAANNLKEATAFEKAVVGALDTHPAGPFRLKRCEIKHINDGFNFLQYHHRRDAFSLIVRRRPADASYLKYRKRVSAFFATQNEKAALKLTARYRWRWMRSFRCWRWNQVSKTYLLNTTLEAIGEGEKQKAKLHDE